MPANGEATEVTGATFHPTGKKKMQQPKQQQKRRRSRRERRRRRRATGKYCKRREKDGKSETAELEERDFPLPVIPISSGVQQQHLRQPRDLIPRRHMRDKVCPINHLSLPSRLPCHLTRCIVVVVRCSCVVKNFASQGPKSLGGVSSGSGVANARFHA